MARFKPNGQMPGRRIKANSRISAANLSLMAQRLGRCGDINPLTGDVCVTQPHEADVEHMAVQIGGPRDGFVYAKWGGTLRNDGVIPTQATPNA
jgi:hypothetical protein